jgi:hypothetical protein
MIIDSSNYRQQVMAGDTQRDRRDAGRCHWRECRRGAHGFGARHGRLYGTPGARFCATRGLLR